MDTKFKHDLTVALVVGLAIATVVSIGIYAFFNDGQTQGTVATASPGVTAPAATEAPSATPASGTAARGGLVLTLSPAVTVELVSVPAGDFLMGSSAADKDALDSEKPQHTVNLAEYLIGKYPVTNAQYAIFVQATNRVWTMPAGRDNRPVVNVSWDEANAFCQWAGQVAGGRLVQLPSEAQWEKAARGSDGRLYPWGNDLPDASLLNFNSLVRDTVPVGQYSPRGDSPYGAADMAGNVYQWTTSLESPYPYRADDGRESVQSHDWRVVRGGDFISGRRAVRSANRERYDPTSHYDDVGFRVVVLPQ
jgi:formylglycine-generating enzyme required for sulfatase activity